MTGPGPGGGPNVKAFSGVNGGLITSFFAYEPAFGGGVRVGVADANRDGRFEIRTMPGPGRAPELRAFDGVTGNLVQAFPGLDPAFPGGGFVGGGRR